MSLDHKIKKIRDGLDVAFIDSKFEYNQDKSNLIYTPELITNNHIKATKVITAIEDELENCDEFRLSVAFITLGGIEPLLPTLRELEKRGIPGKILTTDYQNFSDPSALETLNNLENIELKMYRVKASNDGFHTKGYIFLKDNLYTIITGSSNMTENALSVNAEWNTKIYSLVDGKYSKDLMDEFDFYWNSKQTVDYSCVRDEYKMVFNEIKKQKRIERQIREEIIKKQHQLGINNNEVSLNTFLLKPNIMQVKFIRRLEELKDKGENKALLVSATGTGKTYASAFALRDKLLGNGKALFLIHREQIARQAIESYNIVFNNTKKISLMSGNSKIEDKSYDLLFSTMQMMAKDEVLNNFDPNEFETIIIDEAHRTGANSYQKIMNYFKPRFWLGMTGSPERTDEFDVYNAFDNNIALELRLKQALEFNLLCPFHYFGITDVTVNGEIIDEDAAFNNLVSENRVDHIIENSKFFGYSGDRLRGLIFVSRKEEGKKISELLNLKGYKTVFLSGDDSQDERDRCVDLLEKDIKSTDDDYLDFILTVDIFNEGIDIPSVNQVILLRPTASPIVFIQQLGRGLRKSYDKEFVVILDFIGSYNNNYMIPIALSGDRSYSKDRLRKYLMDGTRIIPGASSIHFDEIAKQKIFDSITSSQIKLATLKEGYDQLKCKLGRIPSVVEFYDYGEIDPLLLINYSKSYCKFVNRVEGEEIFNFSDDENKTLEFVSHFLANGKRATELFILETIIEKSVCSIADIRNKHVSYGDEKYVLTDSFRDSYKSSINLLNKGFLVKQDIAKYGEESLINTKDEKIYFSEWFGSLLKNIEFKRQITDIISLGMKKYLDNYMDHDDDGLVLYEKYTRQEVCRLLNWDKDETSIIYGYRFKNNTVPIFVTYEKKDDISATTKYEDGFEDEFVFRWYTRKGKTKESSDAKFIESVGSTQNKAFLFIKKDDDTDGSDFYYMGRVEYYSGNEDTIEDDKGKKIPIMKYYLKLLEPARKDIYEYLTN